MNYKKMFICPSYGTFIDIGFIEGRPRITMGTYEMKEGRAMTQPSPAYITLTDTDRIDMCEYLEYWMSSNDGSIESLKFTHSQDKGIKVELDINFDSGIVSMEIFQNKKSAKKIVIDLNSIDLRSKYYVSSWSEQFGYQEKGKVIRMMYDFFVVHYGSYLLAHQIYEYNKEHNPENTSNKTEPRQKFDHSKYKTPSYLPPKEQNDEPNNDAAPAE